VGVPWLISTFVLGLGGGLVTSAIAAIGIALLTPSGWIGAVMKLLATLPLVLAVGIAKWKFGMGKVSLGTAFCVGALARVLGMLALNYYWAIPLFTGLTFEQGIAQFPPEMIIIPNFILACVDFFGAYVLVTSTRLKERVDAFSR